MAQFDQIIWEATAELQRPAGDSPHFASIDTIRDHRPEFVVACHQTWKKWHGRAIRELCVLEGFLEREKTNPLGPAAASWARYNQGVWRKVNDTIIWTLCGRQRHVVKRLCFYRARPRLIDPGADAVLELLNKLNANEMSIAIWNDATTCVDVGDITYIQDGLAPEPVFFEVKSGAVNEEIIRMLDDKGKSVPERIEAFYAKRGKKGLAQLGRFLRQKLGSYQAMTLLAQEEGTDPVTGLNLRILEVDTKLESWDVELLALIKEALASGRGEHKVINGCLWVYAEGGTLSSEAARSNFEELLRARVSDASFGRSSTASADRDRIVCLNEGFFTPMAAPLFLRDLDAEAVAAIVYGRLMYRVFMYIDWDAFAEMVRAQGARFVWGSEKHARRTRAQRANVRSAIVRGLAPEIQIGRSRWPVTDPMLVQMYFDGLTPACVANVRLAAGTDSAKQPTAATPDDSPC